MWEIRTNYRGRTIWQGRDAEGRRCYAVTQPREGVAVEPRGTRRVYSLAAAREWARERQE